MGISLVRSGMVSAQPLPVTPRGLTGQRVLSGDLTGDLTRAHTLLSSGHKGEWDALCSLCSCSGMRAVSMSQGTVSTSQRALLSGTTGSLQGALGSSEDLEKRGMTSAPSGQRGSCREVWGLRKRSEGEFRLPGFAGRQGKCLLSLGNSCGVSEPLTW